jgi:hypothetical protein
MHLNILLIDLVMTFICNIEIHLRLQKDISLRNNVGKKTISPWL